MKFLDKINKKEKLNYKVPSSIQDCIPVTRIYKDGIFYLGKNEYSKSYYADVNAFDTVICDCKMPDVFYEKFKNTTFITAE